MIRGESNIAPDTPRGKRGGMVAWLSVGPSENTAVRRRYGLMLAFGDSTMAEHALRIADSTLVLHPKGIPASLLEVW